MAGLKEDPILGIDGITIKEELEIGKPEIDKSREDHPVLETGGAVIKGESLINNRSVIDKVREEGSCGQVERDMGPPTSNSIHRSGSRPQLDLSKAAIEGTFEERDPTILLPNQSDDISHLALDIGGSGESSATLKIGLWFCVGNDVNISFWHDIWVGSLHLSASYPDLYSLAEDRLSAVHLCYNLREKCIWIHDVKGDYTVRSCSSLIDRVTLGENSPIQSFVWKSIAPPKVEAFVWLAAMGKVQTNDFLQQIRIVGQAASMCPFAIPHVKQPIFFCSRDVWLVWSKVMNWCDYSWSIPSTLNGFFQLSDLFAHGHVQRKVWIAYWVKSIDETFVCTGNDSIKSSEVGNSSLSSLIKLVYFSRHQDRPTTDKRKKTVKERFGISNGNRRSYPILGGRLHFVKFETSKINECLDFISSKQLHCGGMDSHSWHSETSSNGNAVIKATGGGAYKFADLFKERLGVSLDKEDEMDCLVAGANFLLKRSRLFLSLFEYDETSVLVTIGMMELLLAIRHEAFTHMEGQKEFVQIDQNDLFPYLLVNIGSGVSMIKVDGDGKFERVSGTNVGGGTYWGLGRLLTKCKSFDELLELSQRGDNRTIDMLVGDIYGGMDYSKIGLSASTIASSFGKTISEKKELTDYRPEDISLSLLRMISYNIGQISYLNALRFGLKRIFFGGFFIRGHAYTMDTISFAVHFWSKGEAQAMFLRHEGFLGVLGAFMSYEKHGLDDLMVHQLVERFPMGAPYIGGKIHGPPLGNLNEKASAISWMEKFVQKGTEITAPVPMAPPGTTGLGGFEVPSSKGGTLRSDASALNVGVLHLVPTLEVFPQLADPKMYEPNTIDLSDHNELEYWFTVLSEHLSDLVDKAVASEGGTDDAKRRGDAFARAFSAHLARLMEEPAAYGKLGLANLLELREECLREFQFVDVYRSIKQRVHTTRGISMPEWEMLRENEASLAVLPGLLAELDSMTEASPFFLFLIGIKSFNSETRLLTLIEGVLAANIFDWGSRACVELYHKGTIIEIYRMSRNKMQRPWRVDDFDVFKERMLGSGDKKPHPHKRALLFVDNSGADVVLGMLPLARELLQRGTEVVLVANSLPALNDVTAMELPDIVAEAAKNCDILRRAAEAGGLLVDAMINTSDGSKENSSSVPLMVVENGCGSPCIDLRQVSSELAAAAKDADLIILEGMGRALHTNFNARFKCEALKLAMVKNQRLAEKLIKGNIYDCVCRYEPAS
ncbi:hypothetical protein POTOM_049437 [Populus tomentosa]|uniref:Pantothenate kinase 2 n=1 Tax=Populus tomentosa TaxID=118781 RepID=A0A8X7YA86_POPTO|nr:hypothetical protein POTOM_049437 [Populus tomentosa]